MPASHRVEAAQRAVSVWTITGLDQDEEPGQPGRRFPPPWTVVEMAGCFIAQDAMGQNVAWYYFRDDPTITLAAAVLLKQKGRREGSRPRWGKPARSPASPRSRYFC
jgi:hypothetical protein